MKIHCVFFDFGGVLAEEGFMDGLHAIAREQGFDPDDLAGKVRSIILENGFAKGEASEADFWRELRGLGVEGDPGVLRDYILSRFTLRPWIFDYPRKLRRAGVKTAILSDQVNWLDELEAEHHFSREFDKVFNSFHYGHTKSEEIYFRIALEAMEATPAESLLIDDATSNIAVAREVGLETIHYTGRDRFEQGMAACFPELFGKKEAK